MISDDVEDDDDYDDGHNLNDAILYEPFSQFITLLAL